MKKIIYYAPDTEMRKIIYYAPDTSMGDTDHADCCAFREWCMDRISGRYPGYDVRVLNSESTVSVFTDDEYSREEIIDFCSRLWDRCPWDWID